MLKLTYSFLLHYVMKSNNKVKRLTLCKPFLVMVHVQFLLIVLEWMSMMKRNMDEPLEVIAFALGLRVRGRPY